VRVMLKTNDSQSPNPVETLAATNASQVYASLGLTLGFETPQRLSGLLVERIEFDDHAVCIAGAATNRRTQALNGHMHLGRFKEAVDALGDLRR